MHTKFLVAKSKKTVKVLKMANIEFVFTDLI